MIRVLRPDLIAGLTVAMVGVARRTDPRSRACIVEYAETRPAASPYSQRAKPLPAPARHATMRARLAA